MMKISIICLIYQSIEHAEFIYNNILKYTPEILTGEAEFYFIANDATDEVINFLKEKNYPYFINNNKHYTDTELFDMGYGIPEYMNRVYSGYNYGIRMSNNSIIMLINSDNAFSPNWLGNLKKRLTDNVVVSPRMIQPTEKFINAINGSICDVFNFGSTLKTFNEDEFIKKSDELKNDSISLGNAFMPVMIYKHIIEKSGYYPEGNLHGENFYTIIKTGDREFFTKLNSLGITHINSNDSIIYHFVEGEKNNKI